MTKSAQKTYTITVSGMTGAKLFEEDTIMKNNSSIKTVVAVGIGAALFFVLGRFVAIPSCPVKQKLAYILLKRAF